MASAMVSASGADPPPDSERSADVRGPEGRKAREEFYTHFYMSINLGVLLAKLNSRPSRLKAWDHFSGKQNVFRLFLYKITQEVSLA